MQVHLSFLIELHRAMIQENTIDLHYWLLKDSSLPFSFCLIMDVQKISYFNYKIFTTYF